MTRDPQSSHPRRGGVLTLLISVAILAIGSFFAYVLLVNPPGVRPQAKGKPKARLVTTQTARPAPKYLMIRAHGTVEAADSTTLHAQVSGQIESMYQRLAPGTRFKKGQVLAEIEPSDYKLALERARNDLASAKAKLTTEQGQQAVAKRELAQVGIDNVSPKEKNLALRGPQLAQAKASVESAQSSVKQARLDLARTRVRAPYAGIVTDRSASIGDVVATSTPIATLAATDAYWVNVSIPVNQLRWIRAPHAGHAGSTARIYYPQAWGPKQFIGAHVLRIQAALEKQGRMARVILQIRHPLADDATDGARLLLGAYVQARIRARIPADAVVIDSAYLREDDHVWVMTANHTLAIRKVQVVYRDNNQAVVTGGLTPGTRIVTTDLSAPIEGRPLRTANNGADSTAPAPTSDDPQPGPQQTGVASRSNTTEHVARRSASKSHDEATSRLHLEWAPASGLDRPALTPHS